jgi:uncharacterized membrane protein YoaK (UPF0700 family)
MSVPHPPAPSLADPLPRALLVLTFTTGVVDAVSYLGLGHVFTANMTGNIVLLGFGIAGSGGLPVVSPLVSLAAFLLGAGAGGRLTKCRESARERVGQALAVEVVFLAAATLLAVTIDIHANSASGDSVIALVAFAMGVRNATVRTLGVPDLTTTVLTMTLTGLAAESRLFGGTGTGSMRRVAAVLAMLAGALCGALLLRDRLALPLAAAAALALATLLVYLPATRRKESS